MRKSFSKKQQMDVLLEQGSKCKLCSITFSKKVNPQFDHIDGDHSNNATDNCQVICANCHDAKSREENVQRSFEQKDLNFVKGCPLCNDKLEVKNTSFEEGGGITAKARKMLIAQSL